MSEKVYPDGQDQPPSPGARPVDSKTPPPLSAEQTRTVDDSGPSPPSPSLDHTDSMVGRTVGKIRIQQILGAGGMGQVFIGFDEKLKRTVALKSIRRHHAQSREMKARFLQEAQILSRLQHPNICQIHDYIEGEGGSDYLVLELIQGQTLKDLDTERLPFEQKLAIAVQLSEALAVAHSEGVVHRDLKPANVMLTEDGVIKILDFGIAQSILDEEVAQFLQSDTPKTGSDQPPDLASLEIGDTVVLENAARVGDMERDITQPLGETTVPADYRFRTQTGSVVGTPQSMSPEQAKGERAGSGSDMYSLGLLLHELFTGTSPYSSKLSMLQLLDAVQRGQTEPVVGLGPHLTTLIERLCSAAPGSRPSAQDTLERLRWIQQAPQRRRQRRLRYAAVAGSIVVAIAMSFQAFRIQQEAERAREAADRAERQAETTQQVLDFFLSLFEASDLSDANTEALKGADLTVGEVLGRGLERLDEDLENQPEIRSRVLESVGSAYQSLGQFGPAETLFGESLDLHRQTGGDLEGELHLITRLAMSRKGLNRLDEAEDLYREALALAETAEGPTEPADIQGLIARIHSDSGTLFAERGRFEEAENALAQALELLRAEPEPDHGRIAEVLSEQATIREQLGDFQQAEALLREVLEGAESHWGAGSVKIAGLHNRLGIALDQQDRSEEAVEAFQTARDILSRISGGEGLPSYANAVMNLGSAQRRLLQFEEADRNYRLAETVLQKTLDTDHPRFGELFGNWGILQMEAGRYDDARRSLARAEGVFSASFGDVHPSVAACASLTAKIDREQRRYPDAERGLRRALEIRIPIFGEAHPQVQSSNRKLARVVIAQGRFDEGRELLASVTAIAEPETAHTEQDGISSLVQADLERRVGDFEAAQMWLDRAGPLMKVDGTDRGSALNRAMFLRIQGDVERDRGDPSRALETYAAAREAALLGRPQEHPWWIMLLEEEALALEALGRSREAEQKLTESRRLSRIFQVEPRPETR